VTLTNRNPVKKTSFEVATNSRVIETSTSTKTAANVGFRPTPSLKPAADTAPSAALCVSVS
jgi:hypothetical protein